MFIFKEIFSQINCETYLNDILFTVSAQHLNDKPVTYLQRENTINEYIETYLCNIVLKNKYILYEMHKQDKESKADIFSKLRGHTSLGTSKDIWTENSKLSSLRYFLHFFSQFLNILLLRVCSFQTDELACWAWYRLTVLWLQISVSVFFIILKEYF